MATMRAVVVRDGKGPIENLYIGEIPKPTPHHGEVLVKIKASGINRMDTYQREGNYILPPGAPDTLGIEFSGTIAEVGEGCKPIWKVGDEVIGLALGGAYAEYVRVRQTNLMAKPQHLTWEEAASIPENFLTAYQALILMGQLKQGEDVLIHAGASGVGIATIQLARLYGANNVIATASTEEKINSLLQMPNGATHGVNYKTQDFSEEGKKITNGKGVDVVIDSVGQSHFKKNIDSLARDGRMTMLGVMSGPIVQEFNIIPLLHKRLRIEGSTLRNRSTEYQADLISWFQEDILSEITGSGGDGKVRTYIHAVYPWEQVQQAHRTIEADTNAGKIILTIS